MHLTCKISLNPYPGLRQKTISVLLASGLLFAPETFSQLRDDFSDGELSADPSWQGISHDFIVNAGMQMQLNATVAGSSWLVTTLSVPSTADVSWEFWIKQSFAPSGANFGRVYLVSDQADLSSPLNGYYLQFGEAGSGDAIELFRQSGSTRTSVCRGTSGAIATAFEIRVKVSRSSEGVWQIMADYSGGRAFTPVVTGTDGIYSSGSFFGISCTYTVSNARGFYFDDVSIQATMPPDQTPPQVDLLEVASSSSLHLVFSEKVDPALISPLHYFVSPGHGHPQTVVPSADSLAIMLAFADAFQNGYQGILDVNGVKDLAGNQMIPVQISFRYFIPVPVNFSDVIITEIFPDPVPQVGLPNEEFVELYNRSTNPIQLNGWWLSDGSSTGRFAENVLMPGDYVIVSSPLSFLEYSAMGPAVTLSNFPTLNNGGDRLVLADSAGRPIDSVHYSITWYNDDDKASGGWTLERIDPENMCGVEENWSASQDARGGTPGKQNSVYASKPDHTGPRLMSVVAVGPTTLKVTFSEQLDKAIPSPEKFLITPDLEITSIDFADASLESLTITLTDVLKAGQTYLLTAMHVYDCPGNRIQESFSSAAFVLPERADAGDVIVNEILFNPSPTGVDFIEIYNRSNKTIDLKGWSVRNALSAAGKNISIIMAENSMLGPNEYRVFTEDPIILKGEYLSGQERSFCDTDLPGFNDDEGSAVLLDDNGMAVDSMFYSEQMHSPFLRNAEGVSLERISHAWPSRESANWRSAASDAGFATPGYVNSNLRIDAPISDGAVIVEPEIIQSGAGRDFAQIRYRFNNGGFIGNVKIFDQEGRAIRAIAGNELLGTEGFFRWDGDGDNGSAVRMGYYFVWFEIFDATGLVKTYKKRIAVY